MIKQLSRKDFILRSGLSVSGLILLPGIFTPQGNAQVNQEKGPPLDPLLVRDFVGAAHKDMAKVQALLEQTPDLLNSVHNLGGWDWEDALGASGHVGIPELAEFLLAKGARMTICVAAMLGKLSVVKSSIETFPYMKDAVGPHKISLMRHARAGGEPAREVLEYLKSLGLRE